MYNKLKDENIIIDLGILVKQASSLDQDDSSYVEFMKNRILSVSGNN